MPEVSDSDHKPVRSLLRVTLPVVDARKQRRAFCTAVETVYTQTAPPDAVLWPQQGAQQGAPQGFGQWGGAGGGSGGGVVAGTPVTPFAAAQQQGSSQHGRQASVDLISLF